MPNFGWMADDARQGGLQIVNDTGNNLDLINHFAKNSDDERYGNWGLRVNGVSRPNARDRQNTAVVFYLGSEDPTSRIECTNMRRANSSNSNVVCEGTTTGLGSFTLEIAVGRTAGCRFPESSVKTLTVLNDTIWQAKSIFTDELNGSDSQNGMISHDAGEGNLHFVQKNSEEEFEFDILFSTESESEAFTFDSLTKGIDKALSTFDKRHELT